MQGGLDSALTDRGVAQARAIGEILRREGALDLPAFTSPQLRAARTADIALGPDRRAAATPGCARSASAGSRDGSCRSWWWEHPALFDEGAPLDWYFDAPGGEGFEGLRARVSAFLKELLPGPAVVVCHGVTARVLRGVAMGLDREGMLGCREGRAWSGACRTAGTRC